MENINITIKDPKSALEYFDNYLKTFNYYEYIETKILLNNDLSVLISRCMSENYTNYLTHELDFKIISKMLSIRIDAFSLFNEKILDYYKKDNIIKLKETFNKYREILDFLIDNTDEYLKTLLLDINMFLKYGGSESEYSSLIETYNTLKNILLSLKRVSKLEDISVIKLENEKRLRNLTKIYKTNGINPHETYKKALNYYIEKNYNEAIKLFIQIEEYKDSKEFIHRINNISYYDDKLLITDDNIFKVEYIDNNSFNLSNLDNIKVKNIQKIFCKFGNAIYYLNTSNKILKYDLTSNEELLIVELNTRFDVIDYLVFGYYLYFISFGDNISFLYKIDLLEDKLSIIEENKESMFFMNDYLVYTENENKIIKKIDYSSTFLLEDSSEIIEIKDNTIIYKNNNTFYLYLVKKNKHIEIESNIFKLDKIYKDNILYEIKLGGSNLLISFNLKDATKKVISKSLEKFIDVKDDYIYYLENNSLCNSLNLIDIYSYSIEQIAFDVSTFVDISNEFIIYQDKNMAINLIHKETKQKEEIASFSNIVDCSNEFIYFEIGDNLYSYNLIDKTYSLLMEDKENYKIIQNKVYSKYQNKYFIFDINSKKEEIISNIIESKEIKEETKPKIEKVDNRITIRSVIRKKKKGILLSIEEINLLKEYTHKYLRNAIITVILLFLALVFFYFLLLNR
ncbi:hypothetical protein IKQ02_02760 [bacterium]|nr:hypothetical protein [bacterium]